MKIFAFPKCGIAYNDNFYCAVEAEGGRVIDGVFSGRWLLQHLTAGDVVHLHWPAFLYTDYLSHLRLWGRFLRFVILLLLIRLKGCRLHWTAHNLLPHDSAIDPSVDVLARRILIALCGRIFLHSTCAARIVTNRFPAARKKLVVLEHGHFIDYYPNGVSREEARRKLRIDTPIFVYLFIGLCKKYKNLEGLIRAFSEIPGDALLLIAGKFQSNAYRGEIETLVRDSERIRLDARFIPDEDLQYYLKASDVVVAPYREILTSGTAMLALSFGRPVIAPALGCLLDVITSETGILYDPVKPEALREALVDVRNQAFDADAIVRYVRRFQWSTTARTFLTAVS